MYQEFLNQALELHKQGKFHKAIDMYNRLLNLMPFSDDVRFLLADAYSRIEFNGLAVNLLNGVLLDNPNHANAWCNLGVAYRKENFYKEAQTAWEKSLALSGDTVEVCSNMAALYADSGEPEQALQWCDRALKCDPDNKDAHWQRGLALLTMGDFDAGWKEYANRQKLDGWDSRKSIDVPVWDFGPARHLYIHGEQGVGDEIMFLSRLDEVLPLCERLTVEVNAKVAGIVKKTWPQVRVVTEATPGDYDAKIPMGSLMTTRPTPKDAYLKPDPELVKAYRTKLETLGPGPYVGLTWLGGTKATRVVNRSCGLETFKPIMDAYTCVSAQYGDDSLMLRQDRERLGLVKLDDACAGDDLAAQAALFKAVDAVVTVQQTAVHVAGAVGAPCFALIPHNPHWRYGQSGTSMPWYSSVRLYRKEKEGAWPVFQLKDDLDAYFRDVQGTEQEAA